MKRIITVLEILMLLGNGALAFSEQMNREKATEVQEAGVTVPKAEKLILAKKGGVVELGDAKIEIPAGALKKDTVISITRLTEVEETGETISNATRENGGYRFLPAGTKFKKEVLITLPYNPELNGAEKTVESMYTYFYDTQKKYWVQLERKDVDKEKCVVISKTTHFTDMINATLTMPETASPVGFNLNTIKELEAAKPDSHVSRFNPPQTSNSGDAGFTIDMKIPAGRMGVQPQVTLQYSSGMGNGLAGNGFDISYGSSITTDTRKHLPKYTGNETKDDDEYLFNGVLLERTGYTGSEGNQKYVIYKPLKIAEYSEIRRYNPRTNNDYWVVLGTGGTRTEFGKNDESSVGRTSGGKLNKYTWNVTKVTDANGNTVEYKYTKDRGYSYISEIIYTGNEKTNIKPMYKIVFTYEEREDKRVDGRSRSTVTCGKRLKAVTTYSKDNIFSKYELLYEKGLAGESELVKFREYTKDEKDYYDYEFEYPELQANEYFAKPNKLNSDKVFMMNQTEGASSGGTINASGGTGIGFNWGDVRVTGGGSGSYSKGVTNTKQTMIDINGDGKPDVVQKNGSNLEIYLNTGNGFSSTCKKIFVGKDFVLNEESSTSNSGSGNVYGGAGAIGGFVNGGYTYTYTGQSGTSSSYNGFYDIDGDGLVDLVLDSKTFMHNDGEGNFSNGYTIMYPTFNRKMLDENEIAEYSKTYFVQRPYRAWRAPYNGTVVINNSFTSTNARAMLFKGNSKEEIKDGKNTKIIEDGQYLYFVPDTINNRDEKKLKEEINWKININYEKIKPFSNEEAVIFLPPLTLGSEIEYNVAYKGISSGFMGSTSYKYKLIEIKSWSLNSNLELNNLYEPIQEKDSVSSSTLLPNDYYIEKNGTANLKTDWEKDADEAAIDTLIKLHYFIPLKIAGEEVERVYNINRSSSFGSVLNALSLFFSAYRYDINEDAYVLDKSDKTDDYRKLQEALILLNFDYDRIISDMKVFDISPAIVYQENKFVTDYKTNESKKKDIEGQRDRQISGSFFDYGKYLAICDNLNGELIDYIEKKDGKWEIPGNSTFKVKTVEFSSEDEKENLKVVLTSKNNYDVIYKYSGLECVDDYKKLTAEEEKDAFEKACEAINYSTYIQIIDNNIKELLDTEVIYYGEQNILLKGFKDYLAKTESEYLEDLTDEELQEFLNTAYELKTEEETRETEGQPQKRYYELRQNVSDEYKTEKFWEQYQKFLVYEQTSPEEVIRYTKQKYCLRYTKLSKSLRFTSETEFNVNAKSSKVNIPVLTEELVDEKEYELPGINNNYWDTEADFSTEDKTLNPGEDKYIYGTEKGESYTGYIQRKSNNVLYGGVNNWYYGIWAGTEIENSFSEAKLLDYDKDGIALNENIDDSNLQGESSNKAQEIQDKAESDNIAIGTNSTKFTPYLPTAEIVCSGDEDENGAGYSVTTIKVEADTGKTIETGEYLIGTVSKSSKTSFVEDPDNSGNLIIQTTTLSYTPYISKNMIHCNRNGGSTFYEIEGMPGTNSSSPFTKSESESDDYSHQISVAVGVNFAGNIGTNDNNGYMTLSMQDMDGDRIPDIVKQEGSSIKFYRGIYNKDEKLLSFEEDGTLSNIGKLSHSYTHTKSVGGSLGVSGTSKVENNPKGNVRSVTLNGPGGSHSESETETKASLMDINGDGIADYVTSEGVKLGYGTEFEGGTGSFNSKKVAKSESSTVNISLGTDMFSSKLFFKDDQSAKELTYGVRPSPSLSLSLSTGTNYSTGSFMDINGDGLVDYVEYTGEEKKYDEKTNYYYVDYKVYYNLGNTFAENYEVIKVPIWDEDEFNAMTTETLNAGNFKQNGIVDNIDINNLKDGESDELKKSFTKYSNYPDYSNTLSGSVSGSLTIIGTVSIPITWWGNVINITANVGGGVSISGSKSTASSKFIDIDGDGFSDFVMSIPGRGIYYKKNMMGTAQKIKRVILPQGGVYEFEYGFVDGTTQMTAKYVLTKVTVSDGSGETIPEIDCGEHTKSVEYQYEDGLYDREEKESYGYRVVTTKDPETLVETKDYYVTGDNWDNRSYYLKATKVRTESYGGKYKKYIQEGKNIVLEEEKDYTGKLISESETIFKDAPYALVKTEKSVSYDRDNPSEKIETENTYYYDDNNYPELVTGLEQKIIGESDKTIKAELTYLNNYKIVGLPSSIEVYDVEGNLLRKREGEYDSNGNLTELRQYYTQNDSLSSKFEHDEYGNITKVTSPEQTTTEFIYDNSDGSENYAQFVTKIKQSGRGVQGDYTTSVKYNYASQTKARETDLNGNEMSYEYDSWNRLIKVFSPYDKTIPCVSYQYFTFKKGEGEGCTEKQHQLWYAVTDNKVLLDSGSKDVIQTVILEDGLGRVVQTAKTGCIGEEDEANPDSPVRKFGWNVSGAVKYDKSGNVIEQGQSYFIESADKAYKNVITELPSYSYEMKYSTKSYYDDCGTAIYTTMYESDGVTKVNQTTSSKISGGKIVQSSKDPNGIITVVESSPLGFIESSAKYKAGGISEENLLTKGTYEYNGLGEMLTAKDALENPVKVTYDLLGRRTSLYSVDTGTQYYSYNEQTQIAKMWNDLMHEKNQVINYEYDGLGRLVKIIYPDMENTVYTYAEATAENKSKNMAGRLLTVKDNSGSVTYKYGKLGEITEETRSIIRNLDPNKAQKSAKMIYESNYLGQMQSITYPNKEKVIYEYDGAGQIMSVKGVNGNKKFDYVKQITYDEYGQRRMILYGNGVSTKYTYDPSRRWLSNIITTNSRVQLQNINYSFDLVGNVKGYENNCIDTGTYTTKQDYEYDDLYQLVKVTGTTEYWPIKGYKENDCVYEQTYAFDIIGNMTSKVSKESTEKILGDNLNYNLDYNLVEGFAHRVQNAGNRYYKYDAAGNIIWEQDGPINEEENVYEIVMIDEENDVHGINYGWGLNTKDKTDDFKSVTFKRKYEWNSLNQLVHSKDARFSTYYTYNADGQRVSKYSDTNQSETLYFNNYYTWHYDTGNEKKINGQNTMNVYLGTERLVSKLYEEGCTYEEEYNEQFFYHSDHLGSAQLITDCNGDEYQRIEYTPYGETWVDISKNKGILYLPYKFSAKELDEETGLYYYGARYLDPKASIWISSDPALGEYIPQAGKGNSKDAGSLPGMGGVYNHINFNLYHYAGNNPIKYTDPDGRFDYSYSEVSQYYDMVTTTQVSGNVTFFTFGKSVEQNGVTISDNYNQFIGFIDNLALGEKNPSGKNKALIGVGLVSTLFGYVKSGGELAGRTLPKIPLLEGAGILGGLVVSTCGAQEWINEQKSVLNQIDNLKSFCNSDILSSYNKYKNDPNVVFQVKVNIDNVSSHTKGDFDEWKTEYTRVTVTSQAINKYNGEVLEEKKKIVSYNKKYEEILTVWED